MLSPHFPPEFGWFGPGRDSMELAMAFTELGHHLEVIACAEKFGAGDVYQGGIRVMRINWQSDHRKNSLIAQALPRARVLMNMNLAFWQAYLRAIRTVEFDIIDTGGFSAESLIPSILAECPVFARIHDRLPAFMEKELSIIGDGGFKFDNDLADSLQAISTCYANSLTVVGKSKHGFADRESFGQVNYSLDTSFFSPQGAAAIDTKNRPSLLVHTAIENEKYKGLFIDIVTRIKAEIPDLWLTLVAHDIFTESSESKLKQAMAAVGIECDMVINQNMSRLLMPGFWRSSWCGLILDWQHLAPYAILEPLACGIPIMAETEYADLGFLKEPNLLLEPKNFSPESIAEKLIALLKSEQQRKVFHDKGLEYIAANHCRKDNAKKIIRAYEETIEKFAETRRIAKLKRMEQLLKMAQSLSDNFDLWLYDLLFIHSFSFRLSHWLKKISKRARW